MAVIRFNIDPGCPTYTDSALGQIWFEFGPRALPCPRWVDFIVFVLDWWRRGIQDIMAGAEVPTQFSFMDDPYDIYAVKSGIGYMFRCTFNDEEIFAGFVDDAGMRELVASYFVAVRAIIQNSVQDPQWRETNSGAAGVLDDLIAAQPGMEALLASYEAHS